MNKYARTKDKLIKIDMEYDIFTSKYKIIGEPKDNLEELTDVFAVFYEDIKPSYIPWTTYERRNDSWKIIKKALVNELKEQKLKITVLGAIWTDKGLIYISKMNKEGGFDLYER